MSSGPALSTHFPTISGGYGFAQGMASVVFDGDNKLPEPTVSVTASPPARRPYMMPGGFRGQWPGYGPFPVSLTSYTAWAMRRYPMVAKVFARITKPVISGSRSIEVTDDGGNEKLAEEIQKAATSDLLPALAKSMPGAMESLHFGYWLQEVVWNRRDGRLLPIDLNSVLPAEGILHVDEYRRFSGYQIASEYRDSRYAFLAVNDPHIDPILGFSPNENALTAWFRATKSAENADAVERKAAGIQLLMYIMQGVEFFDSNGNVITYDQMASQWMNAAASGQCALIPGMAFPKEAVQANPKLAEIPLVKVDKFDWGNQGPILEAHLSRKRELDVDICSAWGIPERAVMESEHGSRADAEAHSDVVLCISEQLHARTCAQWDEQITVRWLATNFGETKVRIRTAPSPLADPQQVFLQQLVTALASNQQAATEIIANLDKRKLLERVEAPVVSEEDAAKNLADAEAKQQAADDAKAKQMVGNDRMRQINGGNGNGKATVK